MSGIELSRASANDLAGQDLHTIDKRLARMEKAAGDQLSKLLAAGLDPAIAQHTATRLTEELQAARQHRNRVATWQVANADRRDRAHRLQQLAQRAHETLPGADHETRRRVLRILEAKVQVNGWDQCETCAGAGWIATGEWHGHKRFDEAGTVCPTCLRHRYLPRVTLTGIVPELTSFHEASIGNHETRWPFRWRPTVWWALRCDPR